MSELQEVRKVETPTIPADLLAREKALFNEEYYRVRHPDIARAIEQGVLPNGWLHYARSGRRENRDAKLGDFEPGFYARSYPLAQEEIHAGKAATMLDHYERIGRFRGYLPNAQAARPDNAAPPVSRFGGLWLDSPNAADLIAGRRDVGRLTPEQADLLDGWVRDGFVILPNAVSGEVLDRAAAELERAYSGKLNGQLFECVDVFGDRTPKPWQPEVNDFPAKALDIHYLSRAIRDALFCPAIESFLELVFESRGLASQSLGFYLGSAQEGHQDTAYVNYSMPRNFVASWVALEDVTLGAGELFYFPGSHRLDDYLYGGRYKTIYDLKRVTGVFPQDEVRRFVASLKSRVEEAGMPKQTFAAKRGDVLMWHADLVHGGNPVSREITRKSVVAHYCPSYLAPLYFEHRPARLQRHGRQYFSTGVYVGTDPAV